MEKPGKNLQYSNLKEKAIKSIKIIIIMFLFGGDWWSCLSYAETIQQKIRRVDGWKDGAQAEEKPIRFWAGSRNFLGSVPRFKRTT